MSAGLDLSTDEGVLTYTTTLMETLRKAFQKNGVLPMGIACIATQYKGHRFDQPTSVIIVDDGGCSGKDALSSTLHTAARECGSLGVVFFSEIWSVDFVTEAEEALWNDRDISEHPRAYEALHVTLEHRSIGARAWEARITRTDDRATVGEFTQRLEDQFDGRFAGFLEHLKEDATRPR